MTTTTTTATTHLILRMDKVQVDYIGDPLSSAAKYVHTCAHTHTHTHTPFCVCVSQSVSCCWLLVINILFPTASAATPQVLDTLDSIGNVDNVT